MGALAATDVSVTLNSQNRDIVPVPAGRKQMSVATVTFGDGSKTYPTGGIPMPVIGQFGYKRELVFVAIEQPPANGFVYKFDRTNHKLKIFTQGLVTGSTAVTTSTNGALVEDSAAAETVVRAYGTAVDTTYDVGALIELPSSIAPASASVELLLIGE